MVKKVWQFLIHYWQFSAAAVAALIGLGFQLFGSAAVAHWLLGIVALSLTIPLLVSMWDDLRSGRYGVNFLAVIAIVTSVLLHQYWTAIVIVILLNITNMLEDYARHRAHAELDILRKGAPSTARVFRGRKTVGIAIGQIQPNDRLLVEAGDVIPADAIILDGEANLDESLLTGESSPQAKTVGDNVLSGTVNLDGSLIVKVLSNARDSHYERTVSLVKNASAHQAPFARLADRYSIPFTIAAVIIAIAAWVIGGHAIRFLQVIVVATPYPLLAGAPIALAAGMSRASKYGILIKNSRTFESLAEVDTLAFDKTGTLTHGTPTVDEIIGFKPFSKNEVLGLAASLGKSSAYIPAKAIVQMADEKRVSHSKAKHVQETVNLGLEATVRGRVVLVGTAGLLELHGVALPKGTRPGGERQTITYVAVDGAVAGTISLKDEVRPETKQTMELLKLLRVRNTLLLTGDSKAAATAIAKRLSITDYHSNALPADKLQAIEKVPPANRPLAFVGDGINDAPLLTAADIGIALGAHGSAAAGESADVVILPDNFSYVAKAINLARRTIKITRQSVLVGAGISVWLMLVFATGHFSPLLGAFLQAAVDILVILNSLRAHLDPKLDF